LADCATDLLIPTAMFPAYFLFSVTWETEVLNCHQNVTDVFCYELFSSAKKRIFIKPTMTWRILILIQSIMYNIQLVVSTVANWKVYLDSQSGIRIPIPIPIRGKNPG